MASGYTLANVRFLTVKECAAYLRIHPQSFYMILKRKDGPPKRKMGKRNARWRIPKDEFLEWTETWKDN
jgi:excisionase family DNA binding protein